MDRTFQYTVTKNLSINQHSRMISTIELSSFSDSFPCEVCSKVFRKKKHLTLHYKSHDKNNFTFKCEICYKELSKGSMSEHRRLHARTEDPPKRFECEICQTKFTANNSLKLHMQTHQSERMKYSCHICAREFLHFWTLHFLHSLPDL